VATPAHPHPLPILEDVISGMGDISVVCSWIMFDYVGRFGILWRYPQINHCSSTSAVQITQEIEQLLAESRCSKLPVQVAIT
jgi:hypothetical protein